MQGKAKGAECLQVIGELVVFEMQSKVSIKKPQTNLKGFL